MTRPGATRPAPTTSRSGAVRYLTQQRLTQRVASEMVSAVNPPVTLEMRAARHAALGDPVRLAIVDELSVSDRAPVELRRRLGMESNLLAHHLDVLERVGLIERSRSSGDGRRRYVHLVPRRARRSRARPARSGRAGAVRVQRATRPARQLAAALWRQATGEPASLGGHPSRPSGSIPARWPRPRRAGLDLGAAAPTTWPTIERAPGAGGHGVRPGPRGARPGRHLAALVDPRPGPRRHQGGVRRRARRAAGPDRPPSSTLAERVMTDELHPTDRRARPRGRDRHRRSSASTSPAAWPPRRSAPAC